MLNKKIIFLFFISSIILIAIFIVISENKKIYNKKLIYIPKENKNINISQKSIQNIIENKFLLTYEMKEYKTASTKYSEIECTLINTNYVYNFIMKYNMISGGFFTKEMQRVKTNVVVLNEFSAFKLFGGVDVINNVVMIDDTSYVVVGVVDDFEDGVSNIYTLENETLNNLYTFIALIDKNGGVSEGLVKNELNKIGVNSENYLADS